MNLKQKQTLGVNHTTHLVGLPGVKRKKVRAYYPRSRTEAARMVANGETITAAGSKGAMNIWRDDSGMIQCDYMQSGRTMGRLSTKSLAAVTQWLAKWWPKLETVKTAPGAQMDGVVLLPRDREVLDELSYATHYGNWVQPIYIGGTSHSHHSRTLAKLFQLGLIERRLRHGFGGARPSYSYRVSQ